MNEYQIVDKQAALDRLDNDEELYNEVVEIYFEDTPIQLVKLKEALRDNVISEVTRISHSIKSASGNIGAERMSHASLNVERASKAGESGTLNDLVSHMMQEFEELKQFFGRP
jgi:HPt (histidine-containing phosphotransfer) domain-containing protein